MKENFKKIMGGGPNDHDPEYVYRVVFKTIDGRWFSRRARNRNLAIEMAEDARRYPTVIPETVSIRVKRID